MSITDFVFNPLPIHVEEHSKVSVILKDFCIGCVNKFSKSCSNFLAFSGSFWKNNGKCSVKICESFHNVKVCIHAFCTVQINCRKAHVVSFSPVFSACFYVAAKLSVAGVFFHQVKKFQGFCHMQLCLIFVSTQFKNCCCIFGKTVTAECFPINLFFRNIRSSVRHNCPVNTTIGFVKEFIQDHISCKISHFKVSGIFKKSCCNRIRPEKAGCHYNSSRAFFILGIIISDYSEEAFLAFCGIARVFFPIWKNILCKFVSN